MSTLEKYNSIDALLDTWEKEFQTEIERFVRDGIVCTEEYEHPHVLFVTRDMNIGSNTKEKLDLRKELRDTGSGWKTWNNAARWSIALRTGNEIYPQEINRRTEMRKVAVVNIKKQAGKASASKKELQDAAKLYGSYTLREIELCDPQIIICGGLGNAGILKKHIFKELSGEWLKLPAVNFDSVWWYYWVNINGKQVPVIDFCHPQVTHFKGKCGHNDLFEPLYREMLNFRKEFLEK